MEVDSITERRVPRRVAKVYKIVSRLEPGDWCQLSRSFVLNPLYHQAQFLTSAPRVENAPPDEGAEVAFAGRSNAGKSSAINTLTQQRNLARVSKTPGRTQLLNFFDLDGTRRIVDLPGYGYAKVPEAIQKTWGAMIEGFLSRRKSLKGVFLIMDIRHPLTDFDLRMIDWCQHYGLPVHVTLTKADKLSRGGALDTRQRVINALNQRMDAPVSVAVFSSLKHQGIEEAHRVLDQWFWLNQA